MRVNEGFVDVGKHALRRWTNNNEAIPRAILSRDDSLAGACFRSRVSRVTSARSTEVPRMVFDTLPAQGAITRLDCATYRPG